MKYSFDLKTSINIFIGIASASLLALSLSWYLNGFYNGNYILVFSYFQYFISLIGKLKLGSGQNVFSSLSFNLSGRITINIHQILSLALTIYSIIIAQRFFKNAI